MTLLIQHGYGKSDYIENVLEEGSARGVIFSARDEKHDLLPTLIKRLSREHEDIQLLFDPQFYGFQIPDGKIRKLEEYPYFPGLLSRRDFVKPGALSRFATEALEYQSELRVSKYIAPAIFLESFDDSWSQIFLTMAQESIAWRENRKKDKRGLLLSLAIDEAALQHSDSIDEFLDFVTPWRCDGVYVVVRCKSNAYPSVLESSALGNLLYIIYVLSQLNDFSVYCGYTDLAGLLHTAVGATAIATGWYNSLRQFSAGNFMPSTGMKRQPRPRYTSPALLNPILLNPELAAISETGYIDDVLDSREFGGSQLRRRPDAVDWPAAVAYRQHMAALSSLLSEVEKIASVEDRVEHVEGLIEDALSLYALLVKEHVVFETRPTNLMVWRDALQFFRQRAEL